MSSRLTCNRPMHAQQGAVPWWAWPTVLSLDAVAVALVWQACFAHSFSVELKPYMRALLGLCVWLIYVLDRWLDGLSITKAHTFRHRFYQRNRRFIFVGMGLGLMLIITLLPQLTPFQWGAGAAVMLMSALYLGNLHGLAQPVLVVPKEVQMGIVFASGCTLSLWGAVPVMPLAIQSVNFALLCFINCAYIAHWEKMIDLKQGQRSVGQYKRLTPMLRVLICLGVMLALPFMASYPALAFGLISSYLLLFLLQIQKRQFSTALLRVLADGVLLCPLLFLPL